VLNSVSNIPKFHGQSLSACATGLVHAYFDINRDILWTTVTEAAPELLAQIKPLLGRANSR